MNGIRIPMTNLFNEKYVDDISSKTQAAIDHLIRHGKYIAPRAPYGYRKNPDDCHVLVVDQETAAIVKDIFATADKGAGLNEIVRQLNTAKVLPPLEYAKANGLEGNSQQGSGLWNTRSIKKILTNRVYVGDLMQGKQKYLVKNTHEALVDRETFVRIQRMFSKSAEASKTKSKPTSDNLLKGKVICGCCGGKMQRRKGSGNADWYFFTCIANNRMGVGSCTGMYIRESAIWDAIKVEIAKHVEDHSDIAQNYEHDMRVLEDKLANARSSLDAHIDQLKRSYEQEFQGQISQEAFAQVAAEKRIVEQEIQIVIADIEQLKQNFLMYSTFRHAVSEESAFEVVVNMYFKKVVVKKDGCCGCIVLLMHLCRIFSKLDGTQFAFVSDWIDNLK